MMSIAIVSMHPLPDELYLQIFSRLDKSDLTRCGLVSRDWQRLVSDNSLWLGVAEKIFGEVPSVTDIKNFLNRYASQHLKSNDEILERIQAFANRVSLGQNARFRCILGLGRKYQTISIEIKGTEDNISPIPNTETACEDNLTDFEFKEDYFAVDGIGNGSLTTPEPPNYQLEFSSRRMVLGDHEEIITYTSFPSDGPFQATLRFPDFKNTDSFKRTEIRRRIENIIKIKLGELESQAGRRTFIKYAIAAGMVLLGIYAYLRRERWWH